MGSVVNIANRKADTSAHVRQLQRTIQELDVAIQATEAGLRITELKAFRTSLNQMKNARYVLQKEVNKLRGE